MSIRELIYEKYRSYPLCFPKKSIAKDIAALTLLLLVQNSAPCNFSGVIIRRIQLHTRDGYATRTSYS